MDANGAELVLKWYLDLEARFESLLQTVPLTVDTEEVFLPSLSSIVLEACSLLDTVFRDGYQPTSQARNANMPAYAQFYDPTYSFSEKRTIVYHHPAQLISPFANWLSTSSSYQPLGWWQACNSLKHDRIAHYHLSTFRTALFALGALHQVLSRLPVFVDSLLRHDMICFGDWSDQYALSVLRGEQSGDGRITLLIESSLFGTPAGAIEFPETLAEISPWLYASGRKLWRYVGRRH